MRLLGYDDPARAGAIGHPSVRDIMAAMRTAAVTGVDARGGPESLAPPAAVSRGRRAAALLIDLATLALLLAVAVAVALAWLLVRTAWGRDDALDGDTAVAFALVGAMPPVWLARLALALARDGATPGQRARGLRVEVRAERVGGLGRVVGSVPARRALRLLAHPAGVVGWTWLAGVAWVADAGVLAWPLTALTIAAILGSLASTVVWLLRPTVLPLHDRLAGTRLVAA